MKKFEISPSDLKKKINAQVDILILDVREPFEYEICRIPNSVLIPLGQLPNRLTEIDSNKEIIIHCHRGNRSKIALKILRQKGFTNVKHLAGGIDAWALKIDKSLTRY